jgi:branched-chain amino acid transport system permease protein
VENTVQRMIGSTWVKAVGVVVLMCLFPLFMNENWLSLIIEMLLLALAASALNLLLGDCGIVSFGHAGFFGVGAYAFGLLAYYKIVPFGIAFLLGIVAVILFAVIAGWFVVRLVEIYFALLCLAFSQIIWVIVSAWYGVTHGDDGLNGIPVPNWLHSTTNCYYFVLVVVALCLAGLYLTRESPFGRSLRALRDNRTRASAIGIDIRKHIFIAFVISGLFCGVAGILLVVHLHCAFPSYVNFIKSGEFLFVCLLGGMYNYVGPIVGAFLYLFLHHLITRYTEYWPLVLGLGIVLIAIFFRGGVAGFVIEKTGRVFVAVRSYLGSAKQKARTTS